MPWLVTWVKKLDWGASSRSMLGIFSWTSGAKVSWSRAPPPKVITITLRFLRALSPRTNGLALISAEPSTTPAAPRRKSRRLRLRVRAVSQGVCELESDEIMLSLMYGLTRVCYTQNASYCLLGAGD